MRNPFFKKISWKFVRTKENKKPTKDSKLESDFFLVWRYKNPSIFVISGINKANMSTNSLIEFTVLEKSRINLYVLKLWKFIHSFHALLAFFSPLFTFSNSFVLISRFIATLLIGNEPWANITSQHDSKNSCPTFETTSKFGSIRELAHQYLNQMNEHQNHFKGTKGLYKHDNNAWFTLTKF